MFNVAADLPDRPVHVLDDIGAGQRPAQFGRQGKAVDRENLVQSFQDTGAHARRLAFQPLGQIADQFLGLFGILHLPCLP